MRSLMAVANSKSPASGKPAPPKQLLPFIAHMAKTEGLGAFYQVCLLPCQTGLRPWQQVDCVRPLGVTTECISLVRLATVEPAQSSP